MVLWLIPLGLLAAAVVFVVSNPLVFNESFAEHAHCIAMTGGSLRIYASRHAGQFPSHTNGYGDALLLLDEQGESFFCLTGPSYSTAPFEKASQTKADLAEEDCGRVYVQGLTETCDPEIAVLFDKLPTPGGDHCHFLDRLRAPLGREILLVDGSRRFIRETDWPEFSRKQIELLAKAGLTPELARAYYSEKPKAIRP